MPEDSSTPDPTPQTPATRTVGGFEVLGRLGRGGMGTVLKARQVSMDRIVALKILPKRFASNDTFVQRFLREARSAAKLSHPNVVQGFDVGNADGYYYFAMEYVDGGTVRDLLQADGVLDEPRALEIATSVAHALDHAQKQNIVHRDIKPDNIMVTSGGVVKLADLGLARSMGVVDTVTVEGSALGTPHFMSPEQAQGSSDIDTRADIYSLGATLFRMVTGEHPYDGPTAVVIAMKHVTQPIPAAVDRRPEVTEAASALIAWMMAKKREDRPQSPTELLHAIERVRQGKPPRLGHGAVRAHPRPAKKSKALWLIAGAAVLAIGSIIGLATRGGEEEPKAQVGEPAPKTAPETPPAPEPKEKEEPKESPIPKAPPERPGEAFSRPGRGRLAEFLRNKPDRRPFPPPKGGHRRPGAPADRPVERVERPPVATPPVEAARAEYGPESDRIWSLLRARKYAEADTALAALAASGDYKAAAVHLAADREAVDLSRELWRVVEKGLTARVGKFVSVAGAGGTLVAVKDGAMTVKTPQGAETRRIDQLTGKQAVATAGLGSDPRSKRMKAVLLLAEANVREDAADAVMAMGEAPSTAFYKARLAGLPEGATSVSTPKPKPATP
ncbi:serine/threonine protein kinase, partial [bacterium]|nr:serine/threonine protein kinase [bacterium]